MLGEFIVRQRMSNKNTRKYALKFNLPIHHIQVRGGTSHRKDFCLEDGSIMSYYSNNNILEKAPYKWRV